MHEILSHYLAIRLPEFKTARQNYVARDKFAKNNSWPMRKPVVFPATCVLGFRQQKRQRRHICSQTGSIRNSTRTKTSVLPLMTTETAPMWLAPA